MATVAALGTFDTRSQEYALFGFFGARRFKAIATRKENTQE